MERKASSRKAGLVMFGATPGGLGSEHFSHQHVKQIDGSGNDVETVG